MKPKQNVNKKTKLPIPFHLVMDYLAQRSTLAEINILCGVSRTLSFFARGNSYAVT